MPTVDSLCERFKRFGLNPGMDWPREVIGKYSGECLIVAGARCVWDDLEEWTPHGDVMVINDIGMHLPMEVAHWWSNHHENLPSWLQIRRGGRLWVLNRKDPKPVKLHSLNKMKYSWPWPGHGTSSLNAIYTAIALGYDRIVLAGIPLDNNGHYFDPPTGHRLQGDFNWSHFTQEVPDRNGEPRFWKDAAKDIFQGQVKSLSGRTRELLGAPA